jgi:hypothetical protein
MKRRTLLPLALVASAVFHASVGAARHINVDDTMVCGNAPLFSTSSASVSNLAGTGNGNTANAGVGELVWACPDSQGMDGNASTLSFNPATSVLYTWINLPKPADPTIVNGLDLSTVQGQSGLTGASIDAMVNVLQLSKNTGALANLNGFYEVIFNYPGLSAGQTCPSSSASLTWAGKTYVFQGPVGLCAATNDFLFSGNGTLEGSVDASGNVEENHLPPQYWAQSGATGVAEPDTLALFCCAGLTCFIVSRRRTPRRYCTAGSRIA